MTIDNATLEANRKCPYGGGRRDCSCNGECYYKRLAQQVAEQITTHYVDSKPMATIDNKTIIVPINLLKKLFDHFMVDECQDCGIAHTPEWAELKKLYIDATTDPQSPGPYPRPTTWE